MWRWLLALALRDIRRLVQLCQKHGMFAWLRGGPFCNAEMPTGDRSI